MASRLVLAVDDEPGVLKLVDISLAAAGFEVLTYDNARDALEEIEEGLRPDVIVSDVNMPAMDGFDFCQSVRLIREMRAVPFIFLTALGEREQIRQGMTLGADDYITKPFDRRELIDAIAVRLQRIDELRKPLEGYVRAVAFGQPIVERDGERVDWDSLKALELFFYFLEHRTGVATFEVAEALWPGKTESKASSSFHTTLYRLRKVMGGEVIESANRRYYLHSKFDIAYDADLYRELMGKARSNHDLTDYSKAAELYQGEFLQGVDSPWVIHLRENFYAEQTGFLLLAGEEAEKQRRPEVAERFYEQLTDHEPYNEAAWQGLQRVLTAQGQNEQAKLAKTRFEKILTEL